MLLAGIIIVNCLTLKAHAAFIDFYNSGVDNLTVNLKGVSPYEGPYSLSVLVVPEENRVVETPGDWIGYIWAEVATINCKECRDIVTVIETGFLQPSTDDMYYDYYELSLVKGYNRAVLIEPLTTVLDCKHVTCEMDLESNCPEENKIRDEDGIVQSCKPAPEVFRQLCPDSKTVPSGSNIFKCLAFKYRIQFK